MGCCERLALGGEGEVDEGVVVGVGGAAGEVDVAVLDAGEAVGEAGVDARVVVGVDTAGEIEVAVEGVLDEDGVCIDCLAGEEGTDDVAGAVEEGHQSGVGEGGWYGR